MVTVKSSQQIVTDAEIASLTGICVDHIRKFAKSRHLGFIARAAEAAIRRIRPLLSQLERAVTIDLKLIPAHPAAGAGQAASAGASRSAWLSLAFCVSPSACGAREA